jgi:hypothetical protein
MRHGAIREWQLASMSLHSPRRTGLVTKDQAFNTIVAILNNRIDNTPGAPPAWRNEVNALTEANMSTNVQPLLDGIPAAPGDATGACTYQIDGQDFCLSNLTQAECDDLGGGPIEVNVLCTIPGYPRSIGTPTAAQCAQTDAGTTS